MGFGGLNVQTAGILLMGGVTALACSSPSGEDPLVVQQRVIRGDADFHDHALAGLGGNGRACSDCHMDANGFQLSPGSSEARFQQMKSSGIDDPLFRPIDADDFLANGELASDYGKLRESGLIRIRMALPASVKLVDPASCTTAGAPAPCQTATAYVVSSATSTDVWRSVPSVVNVAVTGHDTQAAVWPRGPNAQGGYQWDGRVDTLRDQARAALLDHVQLVIAPGGTILDDIAAYEQSLRADAEPTLDEVEREGKAIFDRACAQCHGGPGMSTPLAGTQTVLRFHDDLVACPRPVDDVSPPRWRLPPCPPSLSRSEQTYEISFADGFKTRRTTSDPGRALLSGFVFSAPPAADGSCAHPPCGFPHLDDWQKMDIAPLHGISKTAPYFHDNSAATLEEVVIHYEEFFKHESAVAPDGAPAGLSTDGVHRDRANVPSERAALLAYLSTL